MLSGRLISTLVLSFVRRLLPVKTQKGREAGESPCRRLPLLKDKNPSGELVLTRCRKAAESERDRRREVKVAPFIKSDFGGKPRLLSKQVCGGGCFFFFSRFFFLFNSKFNPAEFICRALCQEGRHAESAGCVFRTECTFIWQVSHPLCLPICCSRHSAAPASAVQTPQAGWLAGWLGWVGGCRRGAERA